MPVTPTERTAAMTRDNFDPVWVIGRLERAQLSVDDLARLLDEACHVIARQNVQLDNARRIAAEMHGMLEVKP